MGMASNGVLGLAPFRILERTRAGLPGLNDLDAEIRRELSSLALMPSKLRGRRIAVTVGSRGVARVAEIARAICSWLKEQGAKPFVFPDMGSHGGATAEGQRAILTSYGVTEEFAMPGGDEAGRRGIPAELVEDGFRQLAVRGDLLEHIGQRQGCRLRLDRQWRQ